jgi:hypothetical protein
MDVDGTTAAGATPEGGTTGRDPAVTGVAVVSLAAGALCALAPAAAGRLLGTDAPAPAVRAIGVADLVLAGGLWWGRPAPWLVARAASNPVIAGVALARARSARPWALATGLAVATASDLRTAARLRRAAG